MANEGDRRMMADMAGEDDRKPLCINSGFSGEDSLRQEPTRHLTPPPPTLPRPRGRRTASSFTAGVAGDGEDEGDGEFETSYKRLYDKRAAGYNSYAGHSLANSIELSSSSEFVSIQGSDVTTQALELCEKWALKHYRRVLVALGWIPPQGECCNPHLRRMFHILLVLFWIIVIIGAFIAQILSCFRRDKFLAYHDEKTWKTYQESCYDLNANGTSSEIYSAPNANDSNITCKTLFCDHRHIFTDYVLFDLLLLAVYLYGVYLFRSEDGDLSYLHNLASRAFVMNSVSSQVSTSSNWRLLLSIMSLCITAVVWITFSLIIRILTIVSAHLMDSTVAIVWHDQIFYEGEKIVLVIFSLVGFLFFDMVYMATAMNHAVQSELLVWLIFSIRTLLLQNHYHNTDAAIKDILECRRYLRTLNGRAATSVALVIFIVGNMAILAALTLNKMAGDNDDDDRFRMSVAILNIITWFFLVSLPIIQATRVTRACNLLKDAAAEIRSRPLLYSATPQLELDSLLLLTHSVRLRATLFGVPMAPALVYGAVAVSTFVAILLSQTDIYVLTII